MGMAASQGRLLMLTARLHDVELRAQQLQNAKLQLSTQQDAAYEEYQKALDATTLTMAAYGGENTIGTFNSIFSMGAAMPATMVDGRTNQGYILLDSRGRVVVDDEIYEAYENYQSAGGGDMHMQNAYQFAWYMVEGERDGHTVWNSALTDAINTVYERNKTDLETYYNNACEALYQAYGDLNGAGSGGPGTLNENNYTYVPSASGDQSAGWHNSASSTPPSLAKIFRYAQWENGQVCNPFTEGPDGQLTALNTLINYFWSHYGNAVFNEVEHNSGVNADGEPYNVQEFNYYVRIFNAIQQHGGCVSISDFDGPDGSAANNSQWLTNMLQSGQLSIEMASVDGNGAFSLDGISVSSDVNLNYSQTSQIDKVALAKAEAKYEHEMKIINKKDEKFDLQLKKIETERTAITKEYDSIKKVSDDNIERTFGIFS